MLSHISINNPGTYLRLRGYPPTVIVECTICPKQFPANEGMAFPTRTQEGKIVMAAYCSCLCYLAAMPTTACWRA
ncbi:MAG: hypothetical protein ACRECV_10570 [Xanthobacteraceae bacterium]